MFDLLYYLVWRNYPPLVWKCKLPKDAPVQHSYMVCLRNRATTPASRKRDNKKGVMDYGHDAL